MAVRPVVSEILWGLPSPPDARRLSKSADAINGETVNRIKITRRKLKTLFLRSLLDNSIIWSFFNIAS